MSRTKDYLFLPCPICGKMPHVTYITPNYGTAYCNGRFLKRHEFIVVKDVFPKPSRMPLDLAREWNTEIQTYKHGN
jgi:hypothetical protein